MANGPLDLDVLKAIMNKESSVLQNNSFLQKQLQEYMKTPIFHGYDPAGKMNDTIKIRKPMIDRNPLDMIAMRLHLPEGQRFPFKDIHAYADSGVAYVFVVNADGKYVVIEDDAGLFPSDALITKLRLLIG